MGWILLLWSVIDKKYSKRTRFLLAVLVELFSVRIIAIDWYFSNPLIIQFNMFSPKKIRIIISVLKYLYLIISILTIILILFNLTVGKFKMTNLTTVLLGSVIYLGLKNKYQWLIPVITIISALVIIANLSFRPNNSADVVVKLLVFGLNIFNLYFFTRKEVKKYFKFKGLLLF